MLRVRVVVPRWLAAWMALSAAWCLFQSQAAFGGTYCSSPNEVIPNGGSINDELVIGDHLAITDLNVAIVATTTWGGDYIFTLEKLAGGGAALAPVELMNQPGIPATIETCAASNIDLLLDDEAVNGTIEDHCASPLGLGGPYTPDSPLSAFDGADIGGTWRLTATDGNSIDGGTLNEWCLITHSAHDVDGDGEFDPLTDGLLLVRRGFGFSGTTLIANAVNLMGCTRCTAEEIEAYIDSLP